MFRILCVSAAVIISALALSAQANVSLPYFDITDLGVLPGMQTSTATGISSSGIVSGYSSPATAGPPGIAGQGFLYANGKMTAMLKAGDTFSVPIAVNASGVAVGLTGDYASRRLAPFVYQNGQFQIPAGLPYDALGNSITLLTGINDSGAMVGNTAPAHSGGGSTQPFVFSDGIATNLPFAFATAIAANGDIAGWSVGQDLVPTERSATFWSNGKVTNIGAAASSCRPQDDCYLDAQGTAVTSGVAAAMTYTAGVPECSFAFPEGDGGGAIGCGPSVLTGIAYVAGYANRPWVVGMNSAESVSTFAAAGISGDMFAKAGIDSVGSVFAWPFSNYFVPGNSYGPGLTIFSPAIPNGPDPVGAFLAELVVNGEGWYLTDIAGINNSGQIVGTGFHNGQQRAFLLTPGAPAPTAPSLYSIAGAGLSVPPVTNITSNGWFSVFGFNFGPPNSRTYLSEVLPSPIVNNVFPTNLAQTCVEVNGIKASLDFVGSVQINAQAPALSTSGTAHVNVVTNCGTANEIASNTLTVEIAPAAPEFLYFQDNNNGSNPVAATFAQSGKLVGFLGQPAAKADDVITVYAVGLGPTTPAQVTGTIASAAATVNGSVILTIGGMNAPVSYAGISPGSVGLYQINLTVPAGVASGNQSISMVVNGISSPTGGYLAIQ